MASFKKKFVVNFIWQLFGQFGYLLISLVGNIVLARILGAYEFGVIGILMFFVTLSKVFTDSGLAGALIRKGEPTEKDYSTIFIFNLLVSVTCYVVLYLCAPLIADYYANVDIVLYIRIIGLILIINAFQLVQYTRLIVKLKYKLISYYSIIANLISTLIGIYLAYEGYGIWSLIGMQLSNVLILTIIYWIREGGFSTFVFSKDSFQGMYKFGVYTTLSSLLNTAFENSYQLILGKYFSINTSGFYYQGKKLQEIPIGIIKNITTGVVFSTLSKYGKDEDDFGRIYSRIVITFTVLIGCICLNLFVFSKEAVIILYGDKWLDSIFYIKVLSIASFFFMQEMFNRNIFKVFDKTERILYLEIIKKAIQMITIIIGVLMVDLKILMYGFVVTSFLGFLINYRESRKIFKKSSEVYKELSIAFKVFIIMIILCFVGEYLLEKVPFNPYVKIIVFAPVGTLLFIILVHFFKIIEIKNLLSTLKSLKK